MFDYTGALFFHPNLLSSKMKHICLRKRLLLNHRIKRDALYQVKNPIEMGEL